MHKYAYTLNGKLYFIFLPEEDKERFENIYEVTLYIAD